MSSKFEYAFEMCTSGFGSKLKHNEKFEYEMEEICEI